jgi:multicomponent Na+:H+ antiporter subunit E
MIPGRSRKAHVKHAVATFLLLAVSWLLWSGYWSNPFVLLCGVLSCLAVVATVEVLDTNDHEAHPFHLWHRPLLYLPYLLWEIVKANWDVVKILLHPDLPISPRIVVAPTTQKTDLGRVIYANSITLTPGTISLDVGDDYILVHALTQATADGVLSGDMDRRVTRLEGGEPGGR